LCHHHRFGHGRNRPQERGRHKFKFGCIGVIRRVIRQMSHGLYRLCGFILSIVVMATTLFATTVQKMELQELVSTSDSIVQGHVEGVEARYEEKMIYTYISITVDDPIKGERRRTVLVRQLGGTIGAKTVWIAGMPGFKPGDQVIVFLRNRQD